jgi:hypothetical protein
MGRAKSDVTLSLKGRSGNTTRLNLLEMADGNWQILRDGKKARNIPYGTSTEVSVGIREWLVSQKRLR